MIEYLHKYDLEKIDNVPYCVIGSGAAGISLAVALSRAGKKVLLVEAGDWKEDASLDNAYAGNASPPHPETAEYRRQRFGGTTHLWGGRCAPLDEHDFELREHVPHSGWPISHDELSRFLPEALEYNDAGMMDFDSTALGDEAGPMFSGLPSLYPDIYERIERYSLPTDFAAKYRQELASSNRVTVLLRARCTALNTSQDGSKIESINLSNGIDRWQVRAGTFVLCGGGLECTRLLLMTRQKCLPWKRIDSALGRYYSCHYDLIFGDLYFRRGLPRFDFEKTTDEIYARRKLHLSAQCQARNRLLNSTFRLHFPPYGDASHRSGVLSAIFLAKSILAGEYQEILNHGRKLTDAEQNKFRHLGNVLTDLPSVAGFAYDWLFKMKLARRRLPYTLIANANGSYPLEFNSEQVPCADNRIELTSETDNFEMQRISVHWQLTQTDIESGINSFLVMQSRLNRTGVCELVFDAGELRERMQGALPIGGHHMGTTRMGESEEDSVVDSDCRVHGVKNLYVASSSVFPTSGHANPTLTIVALALRLADHLSAAGGRA